jgi:carboxyl-terminal processing protease
MEILPMKPPSKAGRWLTAAMPACLSLMVAGGNSTSGGTAYAGATAGQQPPCAAPTAPPPPVTPTTIATIGQAYHCIFDHYVGGDALDDRPLLTGAFAGLVQELDRRGLEKPDATAPALTGDRDRDWTAFAAVYRRVTGELPGDPAVRQAVAVATLDGMVASLHDNHVHWFHGVYPPRYTPGDSYGLGFDTKPSLAQLAPQEALAPLYVGVVAGGPAADAGLRPGDIIEAVNGAPPFVDGIVSQGVLNLIFQNYPRSDTVRITLRRPVNGRTWTVTMKPRLYRPATPPGPVVTVTLLDGDIAGIRLAGFAPNAADQVRQAIATLGTGRTLRGIVLDLRGNTGGSPTEVNRLLGAFVHGKTTGYDCDGANNCTANHTDDTVPLLHLPLVVLTDRDCLSACDAFSAAVKDLHLGTLVGTRTAGVVSGPAKIYVLSDNSLIGMPSTHAKGPDGEIINEIGVAPDIYLPITAHDVSTGHDPDIAKALTLLHFSRVSVSIRR